MPRGCGGVIASKGVCKQLSGPFPGSWVSQAFGSVHVPLNWCPKDAVYRDYRKCCRNRPQWRRSRSGANIYCDSALLTTEIEICQGLRNSNRQNGTAQPYKKEKEEKDLNPWWKMIQISLRIVQGPRSSQSAISVKHSSMYNRLPFIFISRNLVISPSISNYDPHPCSDSAQHAWYYSYSHSDRSSYFISSWPTARGKKWDMIVIIILASHCFPR